MTVLFRSLAGGRRSTRISALAARIVHKNICLEFSVSSRCPMVCLQRNTKILFTGFTVVTTTAVTYFATMRFKRQKDLKEWGEIIKNDTCTANFVPPSRQILMERLKHGGISAASANVFQGASNEKCVSKEFDLMIIGGGATGTGCALAAAVRGLNVACVELGDFSSGTSSKSTKLVHGGVRYLEKAIKNADIEQYKLVTEALRERSTFLKVAPHLTSELPIILPIYKLWQVPYFWIGSKLYDALSGSQALSSSYFMSKTKTLEAFPMLKRNGLWGSMVYYDGQQNDARVNVSLALTAIAKGATVVNYVEVVQLLKKTVVENGKQVQKLCGAVVQDKLTGERFPVKAKGLVNATGPFCDGIRQMDDPTIKKIVAPSSGVHVVFPEYFGSKTMGLIDPSSSDGRVIFFLPWEGKIVAGTTDNPVDISYNPIPAESDINFLIREVSKYLDDGIKIRRSDVISAWSGIRPLVKDPKAKNTQSLVRNHMIDFSSSGLLTISGGKWTTYRSMAEETVDAAAKKFGLSLNTKKSTLKTPLIGSHGYNNSLMVSLMQEYSLEQDIASYLYRSYGDRALSIAKMIRCGDGDRISSGFPYTEAEVKYAVHNEYAQTAVDVLARRTRLTFLDSKAAFNALPVIIKIMSKELHWDAKRQDQEFSDSLKFLQTMAYCPDTK